MSDYHGETRWAAQRSGKVITTDNSRQACNLRILCLQPSWEVGG